MMRYMRRKMNKRNWHMMRRIGIRICESDSESDRFKY